MRKLTIYILFSICVLPLLQAQSRLGVTADVGLAWQIDDLEYTRAQTGTAFSIGGVYQFQHNMFLMQMGIGFSPAWLTQRLDSQQIVVDMLDTEGVPFTYRGYLQHRTDCVAATDFILPIMFGLTVENFYAMLGAKFCVTMAGYTKQSAALTTVGDYGDRYYGVLQNMPQHGFYNDKAVTSKGELQFRPDLRLCAEVGWNTPLPLYARRHNVKYLQLGAFLEYGVLNTLDKDNELITEVDCSQYMNVTMYHVYTTLDRERVLLNNLRVGIRATILFPIRTRSEGKCNCTNQL